MGARGQVVIPAEARKDLGWQPGDQLVVMGKLGKVVGLMKADQMGEIVQAIMEQVSGTGMEKHVKQRLSQLFKPLNNH
jgi:AbrB family looped-hinge helix DNA binding protein